MSDATNEMTLRYGHPHPAVDDIPIERCRWAPSEAHNHHRHRQIIEGRCPLCGGALERQVLCGWCGPCRAGWAYRGGS